MIDSHDLTQGDVWKGLFKFFVPIAVGGIVQQLYNTVDGLVVGRYCGTAALAAITGSVNQILNLMVGTFISLTGGAAVYMAQLYGAGEKQKIKKAVCTSMYLCSVLGIIISIVGYIYSEDLLLLMDTPLDTMKDATVYLQFCFAAAFAVMIYNMGASILRAAGDSRRPFIYLCACSFTNIVLDIVLVKYYHLGVWGAAAATAFSQLVSCVLVLIRLIVTKEDYKFCFGLKNFSKHAIVATIKFGVPSAAQQILYGITNTIIQIAINTLGTVSVAAWSLTSKVDGIYWAIINAAGVAIMNFVGQNYGAGKIDRVNKAKKIGMRNFMIFTIAVGVVLALVGKQLYPFFLDDPEVIELAYKCMLYFISTYCFWTIIEIISGTLKGCGDVIVPTIILLGGIVGIRIAWVWIVFNMYPNIYTLALAYSVSWFITAILLVVRYRRGRWKKRVELK